MEGSSSPAESRQRHYYLEVKDPLSRLPGGATAQTADARLLASRVGYTECRGDSEPSSPTRGGEVKVSSGACSPA